APLASVGDERALRRPGRRTPGGDPAAGRTAEADNEDAETAVGGRVGQARTVGCPARRGARGDEQALVGPVPSHQADPGELAPTAAPLAAEGDLPSARGGNGIPVDSGTPGQIAAATPGIDGVDLAADSEPAIAREDDPEL